jgi:hypothetical protein
LPDTHLDKGVKRYFEKGDSIIRATKEVDMKKLAMIICVFLVAVSAGPASAAQIELWDFELYIDGDFYYSGDTVPGLNDDAFDWSTGIGTLSLTFDPGIGEDYAVDAWFDHDIYTDIRDGVSDGVSFDESASVVGSPGAYGQFGEAYSGDASMWIGYEDIDLAENEYAVIEFIVSQSALSDFYIEHLQDADDSFGQDAVQLFLSSTIDIRTQDVNPVPEPTSLAIMFGGLGIIGVVGGARRRRTAESR